MTTSASLCEGPILYLYFVLVKVLVINTNSLFRLHLGERHMLGKDLYSYVNLEVSIHELLLLTLPLI